MSNVKITNLEIENVKRVRAVSLDLQGRSVVLGGDNCQGKTSVLDAICATLLGQKYVPSDLKNHDGAANPHTRIVLDNGLVVERGGKNYALKVTDSSGCKGGQRLLDSFVSEFSLNISKFLGMSNKERTNVLLSHLGVESRLAELTRKEESLSSERLVTGREADRLRKYADELPGYPDAGTSLQSAEELTRRLVEVNKANLEIARRRARLESVQQELRELYAEIESMVVRKERLLEEEKSLADIAQPQDVSSLTQRINDIEEVNDKIRCNLEKERAEDVAKVKEEEYSHLTESIEEVREEKIKVLSSVEMPVEGLSVVDGDLRYKGESWDCMSGMERIKVSVGLAKMFQGSCGFVLLDGLESFDVRQLEDLKSWLEQENLQLIATRVSKGDECSIIIEDGMVLDQSAPAEDVSGEVNMDF